MALYGMAAVSGVQGDPFPAFCRAYAACVKAWGSDPAYADYRFQIDQAMRGISLLEASPGRRAAMQAPVPTATGQPSMPPSLPSQTQSSEENSERSEYRGAA